MRTAAVLYLEPDLHRRTVVGAALRAAGLLVRESPCVEPELAIVEWRLVLAGEGVTASEFLPFWSQLVGAASRVPVLVRVAGGDDPNWSPLNPAAILSASLRPGTLAHLVAAMVRSLVEAPSLTGSDAGDTAMHALWESEKRYRGIVENAAEGIWSLDQDRVTTYVNARMAEMLGYRPEQIVSRRASDFVFPEDRQRAMEQFSTCLAGKSVRFDFRLRRRDQGELFVSIAASPVFSPAGTVTGVVGLLTDVTTRELVENQLQILLEEQEAERAFLQTLLDNLPVAVAVLNARDFRYRYVNAAMQTVFGIETSMVGHRLAELVPGSDVITSRFYERVIQSREPLRLREFESPFEQFRGTFWDTDYLPVCDDSGQVVSIVVISREVTASVGARKQEQELRQEAEERARDAELGRRKLEEEVERRLALEEQLRRSNQDLLQFAYVISHDLQEPMRNVASFSRLLAQRYRGKFNEQGEEFLGHIMASAERMRQMIDDLLVYSRVAHDSSTEFGTVSMDHVVAEAMANLERAITESQATVTCEVLPAVRGEFGRLAQLLQNLIGNAIKYRSGEPPRIHVSARLADRKWVFSVTDNGVGIEPRYSEQIFGVFRRLHGREFPGTGIGLAIARQIVERHGGRIWVESDGKSGSTFLFTLAPVSEG